MGSPSPPKYPDPGTTAGIQQGYNTKTGQTNQALNMVDQSNPYGSLNYGVTGTDPVTGLPTYGQTQQYTPQQQALLNQLQSSKANVGGAGQDLSSFAPSLYGQPANLVGTANSLTNQAETPQIASYERFLAPQRAQLDTQLRNQGIMPGTPAYQQQVDAQSQQQQLTEGQWLNSYEPLAFSQAQQQFNQPINTIAQLMQLGSPTALNTTFGSTPTTQTNSADYAGQVQQQYQSQYNNYLSQVQAQNSLMSGIFGAGGAILGGPIGGALGSGLGNMMSNSGASFIPALT